MSRGLFSSKSLVCLFLILLCGITYTNTAFAKKNTDADVDMKNYAVLAFVINNETYKYLGTGVKEMLSSQLQVPQTFVPAPEKKVVSIQGVPKNTTDALRFIQELKVNYVIWGNIDITENDVKIICSVVGGAGELFTVEKKTNLNDIILEVNKIAEEIQQNVFYAAETVDASGNKIKNEETEVRRVLPKKYISDDPKDMWRSHIMPSASVSMAIADATGDGKNEVFILRKDGLEALQMDEKKQLKPIAFEKTPLRWENIRVGALDLTGDGKAEIFITSYVDGRPISMVYSLKNNKFKVIAKNVRLFLNTLLIPNTNTEILIGQPKSAREIFSSKQINEYSLDGKKLIKGRQLTLPSFSSVYNIAYLPVENSENVLLQIRSNGVLRIYDSKFDNISTSSEKYNSTNIGLEITTNVHGMGSSDGDLGEVHFIPMRMRPFSFDGKNYEVLLNEDKSIMASFLSRYRSFSQGELQAFQFDGLGLQMQWNTPQIKGMVMDYMFADINNDGTDELCLLVNTYGGVFSTQRVRTVVLVYTIDK